MIYKHAFCSKISKNSKGGPFGDIKKFSKKSRTVPKKIQRGDPLGTLKNFRKKSRTVPKKIQRGDPLGTSGFVCFLEKVKNERGDPLE